MTESECACKRGNQPCDRVHEVDDAAGVAANLRAIEEMALRLKARAIDRSGARDMPGGEATVNLASVGSMPDNLRRLTIAEQRHSDDPNRYPDETVDLSHEDPDEFWPAIQVLWFWSEDYRSRLGHDHDDPRWRPSLLSEAKFLRNRDVADWIWNNEIHWEDYAQDIDRAKSKLESILLEGERPTRSRVVCTNTVCDKPKSLVRSYGWGERPDSWKCPYCRTEYDDAAFKKALAKQMRSEGVERWVLAREAVDALRLQGWQERTVMRWLEPLRHSQDKCTECKTKWPAEEYPACPRKVAGGECGGLLEPIWKGDREAVPMSRCDLASRKRWVWWPDLWTCHLAERAKRELPDVPTAV